MIISTKRHTYVTPDDADYCSCDEDERVCAVQDMMDHGFYHALYGAMSACQRYYTDWDFKPRACTGFASWHIRESGLRVCDSCLIDALLMAHPDDVNDVVHVNILDFSER